MPYTDYCRLHFNAQPAVRGKARCMLADERLNFNSFQAKKLPEYIHDNNKTGPTTSSGQGAAPRTLLPLRQL